MLHIPKLKQCVEMSLFDTSNEEKKYLLICDDKRWQISEPLYHVCKFIDGYRGSEEIAALVSNELNQQIPASYVELALSEFLVKRGLLEDTADTVESSDNVRNKYLWGKIPLIKSSVIQKMKCLTILFHRKVIPLLVALGLVIQFTAYVSYITMENISQLLRFNVPNLLYGVVLLYLAMILHEFGHMAAFMKYGVKPGDIGFGIYFTTPALYSDVSNAWKLTRKQRVLVDVGGMYFEFLYYSILCLIGLVKMQNTFIFLGFIGQISIYRNLNPFLKFDGYWIVSDYLGIPNLHNRTKVFFLSVIYRMFGLERESGTSSIKRKERNLFYIFAIFNVAYVLSFAVGLSVLFVVATNRIRTMLAYAMTEGYGFHNMTQIIDFAKENIGTVILFLILIKIGSMSIKSVIKVLRNFILDLRQAKYLTG